MRGSYLFVLDKILKTFGLSLLSLFVACSKSEIKDKSFLATTSTFDVHQITPIATSTIKEKSKSPWSEIPFKRIVTFKSCIFDVALQIPIQNESISIKTPINEHLSKTNSLGCFSWNEEFKFAFLSQERLLDYPVKVSLNRGGEGNRSIDIKINPWSEKLNEVLFDSRFQGIPQFEELPLSPNGEVVNTSFTLQDININFLPGVYDSEKSTALFSFNLSSSIIGNRRDLQGDIKNFKIQRGVFNLKISLIEQLGDEFKKVAETVQQISPIAGKIQESLNFYINRGFQNHPDSSFYLYFELTPKGLSKRYFKNNRFPPHKGIMPLTGLIGSTQGVLEPLKDFPSKLFTAPLKSDLILENERDSKTDIPAGDLQRENFVIQISRVSLRPGLLLNEGLQSNIASSSRVRRIPTEICLVDTLNHASGKPLPQTRVNFQAFQNVSNESSEDKLIKDTEEKREAITSINGCFQSFLLLTYDYLGCEKFYELNYEIEVLEGRYQGLKTKGKMAINPYINQDFFYDLNLAATPPKTQCEAPQLTAKNFSYKAEGNKREGFKINKFLHLSLVKNYSFHFNPTFFRGTSYQEVESHLPLYFGDYEMTISLFSPKKTDIDYYNFNSNDWYYLTSSKGNYSVNQQGQVMGEFTLPLHLSQTLSLSYKNLLIVELRPKNLNLKPFLFSVPFYALAPGADLKTNPIRNLSLTKDVLKRKANDLKVGFKVPGLHSQFRQSVNTNHSPLSMYQKLMKINGKKVNSNFKFQHLNLNQYNNFPPLEKKDWLSFDKKKIKEFKTQLSFNELRALSENNGKTPKRIINRFCRLFYKLPSSKKNKDNTYNECIKDPHNYLDVAPMSFVEEILGKKYKTSYSEREYSYFRPIFKEDEEGRIKRGNAFFAAYGDRSSVNWGKTNAEIYSRSYSYGMEMHGLRMLFVSAQEGYTLEEQRFKTVNTAEMKAAFNRNYTSRDVVDLGFNSLTLGMNVLQKDCITITSKKEVPIAYQLCRDKAQKKQLNETWFLISDTNVEYHGIISDGNLPGDNNRNQIIRGQENFNMLWDRFETNDTYLIVKEIGEKFEGDAFQKYINRDNGMPFESNFDHSFPGMTIPVSHRPTTSCNDCN